MDPTRSALDEPESAEVDATYTQLVARYSEPETIAAALERVTAEARRRTKDTERALARQAAPVGLDPERRSARGRYRLAIEALVHSTADRAQMQGYLPEHVRIWELCLEIKSVAEISALLHTPLGVARILVADMAHAGLIAIHHPEGADAIGGRLDAGLLVRVLTGLKKL